jgi:hypothetical protein
MDPSSSNLKKVGPSLKRIRQAATWATPGQVDAGFASLSSFVVGLYAIRELDTSALAAYALLFSALHVTIQVSQELVFSPSEVLAVDLPLGERLGMMLHSMPRGLFLAFLSAPAISLGVLFVASHTPSSDLVPLIVSASLLAFVSPVQDHLRSMLHLSEFSWMAAFVSITNFLAAATSIQVLPTLGSAWTPFGALALGNSLSLVLGLAWVRSRRPTIPRRPTFQELRWLGGWLFLTGVAKTGLRYGVTAFLSIVAGSAALGYVEGARVVSQPVNVLSQGLMSQVGPKLTGAGAARDGRGAKRWITRFIFLLCLGAVPYGILTAWPWELNPLAVLAPRAYVLPGLTALTLFVVLVSTFVQGLWAQMLGARMQRVLAGITMTAGLLELAAIGTGTFLGAYAAPLATGVGVSFSFVWSVRALRRIYEEPVVATAAGSIS